jgi:predicted ATPase/DNA-binding SARP family transcriptional activator/predicted negative regulator of RcsB-dependent stress response
VERAAGPALEVAVLGSLALRVEGAEVDVPGVRRRAVLAMLAAAAPQAVTADRLVDAIWPGDAPASGRAALQSHVSRLRRHLGPCAGRLERVEGGYRLLLDPGGLDATRFETLLAEARAVAPDDPGRACPVLVEALGLWRGDPLPELAEVEPVASWCRALADQRLDALDLLSASARRAGDATLAVRAAQEAVALDPLREPGVLALVRALASQGRASEALRAAAAFRHRLVEEVGLDPTPALAELESEVAAGTLASGDAPVAPPREGPGRDRPSLRSPPAGALLGREAELAGLERLVATERTVTVVGPGGVGKTRLALEVAHRAAARSEPADVTVLHLAPVTDAAAVDEVLARSLGLAGGAAGPRVRALARLQHAPHLLVVDCCEHLLAPVRDLLSDLLDACADLAVLATSRERLGLPGEQVSRLAPLRMPALQPEPQPPTSTGAPGLAQVPSVALFVDRARRARPELDVGSLDLAAVARIVRALDGMPLAIELAAGRLSSLTLADLEARLDRALDLLSGPGRTPDDRHGTLRAAVAWSYDLLTAEEQRLFRNLAAFPGGVDLATVESVAADLGVGADPATALARLVDASMVVADLGDRPRYRMLDTLRRFGLDALDAAGEAGDAAVRLRRWALDVVGRCDAAYETESEPDACLLLVDELANLRTAWRAARDAGDLDAAASMVVELYSLMSWRDLAEVWGWYLELAADPHLVGHPREAQVLGAASEAAWSSRGDLELSEALARRAVAVAQPHDERGTSLARWALADLLLFRGRYREGARMAIEARESTRWAAEGYAQAALALTFAGDLDEARANLASAEAHAGGPTLRGYLAYVRGELANAAGERDAARTAYQEAIERARRLDATFLEGIAEVGLVTVLAADGRVSEALEGYAALLDRWERSGSWTQQWTTIRNLADLLERLGDQRVATLLRAAADAAPEASEAGAPATMIPDAPGKEEALTLARESIRRALARH